MSTMKQHYGVGLVEVLVALLLLAVAVLGFTAMQVSAIKATDESLMRTRSLTIMRGGAETMRANPDSCTIDQLATRDALLIRSHAIANDIKIGMVPTGCPSTTGNQERQCFVASWGDTTVALDDTASNACAKVNGTYKNGAECFIMEAY